MYQHKLWALTISSIPWVPFDDAPTLTAADFNFADTFIQANTKANTSTMEFELHLTGIRNLNAGDFIL